jgi:hypothetical protein
VPLLAAFLLPLEWRQSKKENPPPSQTELFVRVFGSSLRVLVRGPAFVLRIISMSLGFFMATFIMLIDCLEMVVGCGDVMGRGKMMMLARRVVALRVRHDASLTVSVRLSVIA